MNAPSRLAARSLLILAALVLAPLCRAASSADDIKFDTVKVTIKEKPFTLEVADTEEKRERGLMNRDSMPADHGMLFVFDTPGKYGFWMKDTKIPLDLIFLDASGKVVGIYALKPNDETSVGGDTDSSFALELNAGTVKSLNLKTGDAIALPEKVLKRNPRSDEK